MKLKENSLILICLVSSISGLTLIYIAAINIQPKQLKLSEINFDFVGRAVKTSGYIVYKSSHPAGHVFLTISEGKSKIQVPLFAGFMNALNGNGLTNDDFIKGRKIEVEGLVGEYLGSLQIIPRKADDIKILK